MKKLFFTAIALVAFSGVSFGNTIVDDSDRTNCSVVAYITATIVEEDSGGCLTSSQWNAVYNAAYWECTHN